MVRLSEFGRTELQSCPQVAKGPPSVMQLIHGWRRGDELAAGELYHRWSHKVECIVRYHVNHRFRQRISVDDVSQLIFQDVFSQLRRRDFDWDSDSRVDKWVFQLARYKSIKCIKHERAEKRDVDRESRPAAEIPWESFVESNRYRTKGSACQSLSAREELARAMARLDSVCQRIVQYLAEGRSQLEIARLLHLTDRTIRRKMKVIRGVFPRH